MASLEYLLKQGQEQLDRGHYQAALETLQEIEPSTKNLQALYGLGLASYLLGNYKNSIDYLTQALECQESYTLALALRGLAYKNLISEDPTNKERAQADFVKATQISPINYEDWRGQGLAYAQLEELEDRQKKALEHFEKALNLNHEYYYAWCDKAMTLSKMKLYEDALESFNKAIELKQDYYYALVNRGEILQKYSHEFKEVKDAIASNEEQQVRQIKLNYLRKAIADWDTAIELNPDSHELLIKRGNALWQLDDCEDAISSYKKACQLQHDNYSYWNKYRKRLKKYKDKTAVLAEFKYISEEQPNCYGACYSFAIACSEVGQYAEAIKKHEAALLLQADNYDARKNYVEQLLSLLKNDHCSKQDILASFNNILNSIKDCPEIYEGKGDILFKMGKNQEAMASYGETLILKNDDNKIYCKLGNVQLRLGRHKDALESYNKALIIKSDDFESLYGKGNVLFKKRLYSDALNSFEQALFFKPGFFKALIGKGDAYTKLDQYDEAIKAYKEAQKIMPKKSSLRYWNAWGWAYFNRRPIRETNLFNAQKIWDEGLSYFPKDKSNFHREAFGVLHYSKGRAFFKKQRYIEAKENYIIALEAWRNLEMTIEVLKKRLSLFKDLLQVCSYLGLSFNASNEVERLLQEGTDNLARLQNTTPFKAEKIELEKKFGSIFNQSRVDFLAHSPEKEKHKEALEIAEQRKNSCLSWFRYGWNNKTPPSATEQDMQKLLNLRTAAVYWHISPAAITTFILRHDQDPYILPAKAEPLARVPSAISQIQRFERWMKAWKNDYRKYRNRSNPKVNAPKGNQADKKLRWHLQMYDRLETLADILDITGIINCLPSSIDQLILIPHRDLHLLPLHALFWLTIPPETTKEEYFTITYLPSFQKGINLTERPSFILGKKLLSVKDPKTESVKQHSKDSQGMIYAELESAVIDEQYQVTPISAQAATKDKISQELKSNCFDLFHFTGHGYHNIDEPLKSALVLAGKDQLRLPDIFSMDLGQLFLVCLSACETGITSSKALTDEYVGLVSGFLAAGAAHVISTLWIVDEISCALLMIRFHQLLNGEERIAPAKALQRAQDWVRTATHGTLSNWYRNLASEKELKSLKSLLEALAAIEEEKIKDKGENPCPFKHPYCWAGFIIAGKVPL